MVWYLLMIEEKNRYFVGWHNFRTGEVDYLRGSPESFEDYIPQVQAAQAVYKILVENMGEKPIQAALRVLSLSVGEK